jgi:hypothetical protein
MKRIPYLVLLAAGMAGLIAGCADEPVSPSASTSWDGQPMAPVNRDHLTRVDRMGMPAIATAVISSKDAYNQADPIDDAAGTFVSEIVASVDFLHSALDDDLLGLGLTPCATMDCVGQAAPFVVPDVITIDPSQPAGFPNGRRLTDPVIDVTLALVLLDLGVHDVTTLVGVNPTANDRKFRNAFPYLAGPHRGRGEGRLP